MDDFFRLICFLKRLLMFTLREYRTCRRYDVLIYSLKYNQQDAKLYHILYYCQCSTCFRRFLRPSSGIRHYVL